MIFLEGIQPSELDWFGIIWNVIRNFHFVSKTYLVLIVDDLFPRSDDGLGKCKKNFFYEKLHLHLNMVL
jgi:hypothetical protein